MAGARRFRKKAVEVDAVRFLNGNFAEVYAFTGGSFRHGPTSAEVYDRLHDSWIKVYDGHWVVRGVKGEFYPLDQAVLLETYDEV